LQNPPVHRFGKRQAGILIPAFSPRREGDLGIGDTLGLREWIDWAARHGVGFIQLLPINENGTEESPYSGISSIALDPIYLTITRAEIPWLAAKEIARARERMDGALEAEHVDYPVVRKTKRNLLELAWTGFDKAPPSLAGEFERFRKMEAEWLDDYCLFRYLMELHGEELSWDQWPSSCQTPHKARAHVATLRKRDAKAVDYRLGFFAFVQWLCFRQWRALRAHGDKMGVKLMGDVPIGISWHSCDVFFNQEEFHLDWCGGSPPEGMSQSDPFFQQWGQNWGIPLYRWDHMQANGFKWWHTRISRLTEIFEMFRLDHILGFYRIYAFPWRPERNHEFLGLSHEQAAHLTGGRLPHWFLRPDDTRLTFPAAARHTPPCPTRCRPNPASSAQSPHLHRRLEIQRAIHRCPGGKRDRGTRRTGAQGRVDLIRVPGAFEIPVMVASMLDRDPPACIIALGLIIRGSTEHADLIGKAVTDALQQLAIDHCAR
jgi:4-alpha-glucanotransferase